MGILVKRLAIRIATSQLYVEYTDDNNNIVSSTASSISTATQSSTNSLSIPNRSSKIMHQIITLQPEARNLDPLILAQKLREAYPHLFPLYIDDSKLVPLLRALNTSSLTDIVDTTSSSATTAATSLSPRRGGNSALSPKDIYNNTYSPLSSLKQEVSSPVTNNNYSTNYSTTKNLSSSSSSSAYHSTNNNNNNNTNAIPAVIATIGDLQKVGPAALQLAKAKMDIVFEANKIRPGDDTFIYDKRTDFVPTEESEWDD